MRLLGDAVGVVVCVVAGGTGHCGGAFRLPHWHRMSEVPVMAWSQGTSYFTSQGIGSQISQCGEGMFTDLTYDLLRESVFCI